jgi:hypothetical protein
LAPTNFFAGAFFATAVYVAGFFATVFALLAVPESATPLGPTTPSLTSRHAQKKTVQAAKYNTRPNRNISPSGSPFFVFLVAMLDAFLGHSILGARDTDDVAGVGTDSSYPRSRQSSG